MQMLKAILIRRGERAKTILDDEVLQEALTAVRSEYINALLNSKAKESEVRELAYTAVRLLTEIEGKLRTYVSEAVYEQKLEEQNKP